MLVSYDLLGMNDEFRPRFVKRYEHLGLRIRTAVENYVSEVREGRFPDAEHAYGEEPAVREGALYGTVAPSGPAAGPPPGPTTDGSAETDAIAAGCIPLRPSKQEG